MAVRGVEVPATFEERLAALDALRGHVEAALLNAEEAASGATVARRGYAAELRREDARVARLQLDLLRELKAWMLGARPQQMPATATGEPVQSQTGVGVAGRTSEATRTFLGPAVHTEDGERW